MTIIHRRGARCVSVFLSSLPLQRLPWIKSKMRGDSSHSVASYTGLGCILFRFFLMAASFKLNGIQVLHNVTGLSINQKDTKAFSGFAALGCVLFSIRYWLLAAVA
jgi:hypothetical protein